MHPHASTPPPTSLSPMGRDVRIDPSAATHGTFFWTGRHGQICGEGRIKQQRTSTFGSYKLVQCIIPQDDAHPVQSALARDEFESTVMVSTTGFPRERNVTLLLGTDDWSLDRLLAIIRKVPNRNIETMPFAQESTVKIRSATIFVLGVEAYYRLYSASWLTLTL